MGGGEPIGVAGRSAGGRIALALAARHPQLVNRVVVLGTPAPHEHIPWIPRDQHLFLERLGGMPPATARITIMQHLTAIIPSDMRDETALSLLTVSAAVAHVAAHELGAAAYAIKAARAASAPGAGERAGRLECQWQRAQLPAAIRALVLDDQRRRNDLCWSVFDG